MWYHYLVGLLCVLLLIEALYTQVKGSFTWVGRLISLAWGALYAYGALWSYRGITAPVSMFGGWK
jgi:hypothetical protein